MGAVHSYTREMLDNNKSAKYFLAREHQRILTQLERLSRILEDVVYSTPETINKAMKTVNFSRLSNYQIIGQCMKKASQLSSGESDDSFQRLIHLTGRIEKIIGQSENELINSLNHFILEPIQLLRLNDQKKIYPLGVEFKKLHEEYDQIEKFSISNEKVTQQLQVENKIHTIESELNEALMDAVALLRQLEINVFKFVVMQKRHISRSQLNVDYLIQLLQAEDVNSQIGQEVQRPSKDLTIPSHIVDYRAQLTNGVSRPPIDYSKMFSETLSIEDYDTNGVIQKECPVPNCTPS